MRKIAEEMLKNYRNIKLAVGPGMGPLSGLNRGLTPATNLMAKGSITTGITNAPSMPMGSKGVMPAGQKMPFFATGQPGGQGRHVGMSNTEK